MKPKDIIDKATIAHDFAVAMDGKLEKSKIDAISASLLSTTDSDYYVQGYVVSAVFYQHFTLTIQDSSAPISKTFNGNAGGITLPLGGALAGRLHTDDVNRLYRDTIGFQFNAAPVYFNINFFDGYGNLLGHFHGANASTVIGTGGGTGGWTPKNIPLPTGLPAMENQILPGQVLMPGQSIISTSGGYIFTFQDDGNLNLSDSHGNSLWNSGKTGPGGVCIMQFDGNLVIYDANKTPVWATNTFNYHGSHFILQDDGNAVLYTWDNVALWATSSGGRVGG